MKDLEPFKEEEGGMIGGLVVLLYWEEDGGGITRGSSSTPIVEGSLPFFLEGRFFGGVDARLETPQVFIGEIVGRGFYYKPKRQCNQHYNKTKKTNKTCTKMKRMRMRFQTYKYLEG